MIYTAKHYTDTIPVHMGGELEFWFVRLTALLVWVVSVWRKRGRKEGHWTTAAWHSTWRVNLLGGGREKARRERRREKREKEMCKYSLQIWHRSVHGNQQIQELLLP